ncbi:MAG: DNA-3-methyladenine glycosylase I [Candidatus Heimdallarchaeota archaeon]|nr:DNA-3-methyladenine glycosylase I [Candidatus Heimdallarchaeota archaeon]
MESARTSWFKRSGKSLSDNEVFENLTRVIFQGGLSWDLIQRKWPSFQQAFDNFSIDAVSKFTDDDIANLIENEAIIRNSVKIEAAIHNAIEMQKITNEFGSFFKYLDSIGREKNYATIIKDLTKRMKRLGKKSSYIFLYSIGENIEWDIE